VAEAFALTHRQLARVIPDRRWARWAAQLLPVVAIEAVTARLDAGQPDREQAAERIRRTIYAVNPIGGRTKSAMTGHSPLSEPSSPGYAVVIRRGCEESA
jgi:hypothetical protein